MPNQLVSVIIRTSDRHALLREAIQSVLKQTYSPVEIIIIDDGEFSSEEIVKQELNNNNRNITWHYIKNMGPRGRAHSANLGLDTSTGEHILFLDDDDIILENHIQKLIDAINKNPDCVLAYTDTTCVDINNNKLGEFRGKHEKELIIGANFLPIHSAIFKRSALQSGARFDQNLDLFEDWDFWIQLSRLGSFTYTPGESAIYRQIGHCQTRSGINNNNQAPRRIIQIIKKWSPFWSDNEILELNKAFVELYHLRNKKIELITELENKESLVVTLKQESEKLTKLLEITRQEKESIHLTAKKIENELRSTQILLENILQSRSWRYTQSLRSLGRKARSLLGVLKLAMRYHKESGGGISGFTKLSRKAISSVHSYGLTATLRKAAHYAHLRSNNIKYIPPLGLPPAEDVPPPPTHSKPVDIIVCVHNALSDTQRCLKSIIENTSQPFRIIIVDDGSQPETASYLLNFHEQNREYTLLIRNEEARGYTLAANQGLRASEAEYVILLNSDTIVSQEWVDRLIRCIESDERIGIVGPLSNTASWQSIPEIEKDGDWAENPLPEDITISKMAQIVASNSALTYPTMHFLNGFCMLIKRAVIEDIGYFDEVGFAQGYGEENDFCLRARKSGWLLALADDVYVYHAQSKSYSSDRRKKLSERAALVLAQKHGDAIIAEGVEQCRHDRVLEGIRSRSKFLIEQQRLIDKARAQWSGIRVAFVLPVTKAGGGANVVLTEAKALIEMGINVTIINLESLRKGFETSYPSINIPVVYAHDVEDIPNIASQFDIAIATLNTSVYWLAPISNMPKEKKPILGYYVQDFEPYFYDDPHEVEQATNSYQLINEMILFTKTEWNHNEVAKHTGVQCHIIGPSVNTNLFRPRSRIHPSWPSRPLRICAMIRPSSPRRGAQLTMEVLSACSHKFGNKIEIILFGTEETDPEFQALRRDFPYQLVGLQRPEQLAALLNEVDIFVDFSTFQAMGLTAMEAMACGVAVIVPSRGGAQSYASHLKNALVIDTENKQTCISSLELLITNHNLRTSLQNQAIKDITQFFPEKSAFLMMNALLPYDRDGKTINV